MRDETKTLKQIAPLSSYVLDTRPQFGPTHDEYEEVCKPRERRTCADTGMGWDEETRPETLAKYFPNRDSPVFKAHYKDLNDVYLNHLDYVPDK